MEIFQQKQQMRGQALGLIETRGYAPLVMAVDGALKAAQVVLTTKTLVGGGLANATVRGDVGSVRAALEAAGAIINQMGADGMTHVIARPDASIWALLEKDGLRVNDPPPDPGTGPMGPAEPPAVRPDPGPPATRAESGAPTVKPESEPPVFRAESEVPAIKTEAGLPVVQKLSAPSPGPAALPEKSDGPKAAKSPGKPKKPRKTTKK